MKLHSARAILLSATLLCGLSVAASAHAADLEKGKTLFESLCSSCHGTEGLADGPVALSLPPEMKPRNLQKDTFKFATDDDKFRELLHKGGAGVGLNPLMPSQPAASEDDITNIIAFVRTLKK